MISYKLKKTIDIPKSEYIIVENTHDAIIEKSDFYLVQELVKKKCHGSHSEDINQHLLSGLIYCPRCGGRYSYANKNNKVGEKVVICDRYRRYGNTYGDRIAIEERDINRYVLQNLKEVIVQKLDRQKLMDSVKLKEKDDKSKEIKEQIEKNKKRIDEISSIIKSNIYLQNYPIHILTIKKENDKIRTNIRKKEIEIMDLKLIENGMIPIYEDEAKEKLVNARELFRVLESKQDFSNWIKNRIRKYEFTENTEFFKHDNFIEVGNLKRPQIDYFLTIDTAKEIAMIENNIIGRQIRRYFIEVEKRYRNIIENPTNIFDFMRLALDQIEANEKRVHEVEILSENTAKEVEEIKQKIDVVISKDYCLASDIAEQLGVYSESKLPHSNFIGAIARQLGYKNTYKHYYEDEYIAIVKDISKGNDFWQIYYKQNTVKEIIRWFNENKDEIEYKIVYERNSKNGVKGEVREQGYKIENICYKVLPKDK